MLRRLPFPIQNLCSEAPSPQPQKCLIFNIIQLGQYSFDYSFEYLFDYSFRRKIRRKFRRKFRWKNRREFRLEFRREFRGGFRRKFRFTIRRKVLELNTLLESFSFSEY